MENNKNLKRPSDSKSTLMNLTGLAFRMGITIAIGTFLGKWIDNQLGLAAPIFTLILCLISVGIAIYIVYKDASPPKK